MNNRLDPLMMAMIGVAVTFTSASLWLFSQGSVTSPFKKEVPSKSNNISISTKPLRLLGDTFSGYSVLRSSAFEEALKDKGIQIKYENEFDQAKRAEQLRQGKADFIVTTMDQYLKNPTGKIVGLIDQTVGADAVVLNTKKYPGLKSLLDLSKLVQQAKAEGKPLGIAFAGDTPSEYLALVLDAKFDAFNLSDFSVTRVIDASDAWKLMQDPRQNVAVTVLWEPFVTQARQKDYSVVLSSKDVPGVIVDVLIASDRLIQSQPRSISSLLEVYYQKIDASVQNSATLQSLIAKDGNLSPADATSVIQGIEFFTATESQNWFKDGTLERRINSTAAVLTLADQLKQVPAKPKELFSSEFITQAATNTKSLIDLVRADNPSLADQLSRKVRAVVPASSLQVNQIQSAPNIGNLKVRGEVDFATGSDQLSGQSLQTLNQLAQEIKEFNEQTVAVRVIGHTSQTGAADINQTLSQKRAQVVVDYLRGLGLQYNMVAEGKGSSQPLPNTAATDERNQRTEVRLVRIQ